MINVTQNLFLSWTELRSGSHFYFYIRHEEKNVLKSSFPFITQMLNHLNCVGCSLAIMLSSEKILILQIEIRFKSLIQIITIIFCGVWSCIIVKRKSVQSANSYVEMNQKTSSNFGETEKIGANRQHCTPLVH